MIMTKDTLIARYHSKAVIVNPTPMDEDGKWLDFPTYFPLDLHRVCPRCGTQGMAVMGSLRPPLKGYTKRRRPRHCLFCGVETVLGIRANKPIFDITVLPEFNPDNMADEEKRNSYWMSGFDA